MRHTKKGGEKMRITATDFSPREGEFLDQDLLIEEISADGSEGETITLPAHTMVWAVRGSETDESSVSEYVFWTPSGEFWRAVIERMRFGRGWLVTTRVRVDRLHRVVGSGALRPQGFSLGAKWRGWRGLDSPAIRVGDEGRTIKVPPGGILKVGDDLPHYWIGTCVSALFEGGPRGSWVVVEKVRESEDLGLVIWLRCIEA